MPIRATAVALLAATLAAQTSTISGTIRNAYNQIPIPGVQVRLDGGERPLETFTDAAGRFRFSDIPQTTYNLRIEKDGYLFQPDYALPNQGSIVLEDQPLSLDYVMDQWASLSGCVRDADDKPFADVAISLTPRGTPLSAPTPKTNAQGCYEFERVFPGSYYVEARLPGDTHQGPSTFYPGTANPSQAQRVSVAPGGVRNGVDIPLATPTLGVISGRLVDEQGKPLVNGQIMLNPAEGHGAGTTPVSYMPGRFQPPSLMRIAPNAFPIGEIRITHSGPDGRFRVANLLPGTWRLIAGPASAVAGTSTETQVELAVPTESAPETVVELTAQAIWNAQLDRKDERSYSFRVQLDWSGAPPHLTRALQIDSISTLGMPRLDRPPKPGPAPTSMPISFVSTGLYRNSALAQSDTLPEGFYFAAMRQGGVDLQGQPAQLTRNAPSITLVFKTKAAQISGALEGEAAAIVLLWGNDIVRDPFVRTAVANPGDSFHFGSLAPGTYHLAAFDRIPPDGLAVPFLNALTLSATTVNLTEGSTASPKLKARRWLE